MYCIDAIHASRRLGRSRVCVAPRGTDESDYLFVSVPAWRVGNRMLRRVLTDMAVWEEAYTCVCLSGCARSFLRPVKCVWWLFPLCVPSMFMRHSCLCIAGTYMFVCSLSSLCKRVYLHSWWGSVTRRTAAQRVYG
mmetsp:Transcript_19248/g.46461  ORF Transcript_19248/g.46461 Transcript_19248/m.46461 type:complete len:136 (-) Transcript_19248:164-571(-)